jgi:hypothetical protein
MYSMVLMAALTTGSVAPECHRWGGCCGCYGGYGGGCYGGCYGGYGGCYGGGGWGGCYGCWGGYSSWGCCGCYGGGFAAPIWPGPVDGGMVIPGGTVPQGVGLGTPTEDRRRRRRVTPCCKTGPS